MNSLVLVPALACGVLALAFGLIILGIRYGKKAEQANQSEENIKAIKDKKSIDEEVSSLDDDKLDDSFNRWMRK